jgi:hypothetical protein
MVFRRSVHRIGCEFRPWIVCPNYSHHFRHGHRPIGRRGGRRCRDGRERGNRSPPRDDDPLRGAVSGVRAPDLLHPYITDAFDQQNYAVLGDRRASGGREMARRPKQLSFLKAHAVLKNGGSSHFCPRPFLLLLWLATGGFPGVGPNGRRALPAW